MARFQLILLIAFLSIGWTFEGGWDPGQIPADKIKTDTTNFDSNLSTTDTDLQTALDTLDEITTGGGSGSLPSIAGGSFPYAPTTGTVYTTSSPTVTLTNSNKTFNVGSTTFNVNTTNGRVGIGTSSPVLALNVVGAISITDTMTASVYYGDGSNLAGVIITESDPVYLASSSASVDTTSLDNITKGGTAYGWNNHADAGYLTGNQWITCTGEIGCGGTTSIVTTLAEDGISVTSFTVSALSIDTGKLTKVGTDLIYNTGSSTVNVSANSMVIFQYDGGGSTLTTTSPTIDFTLPYNGTFVSWTMNALPAGSCTIDLSKATYSNYPNFTDIDGSNSPKIPNTTKATDSTLSGWTTTFAKGDVLRANLNGTGTVNFCNLNLEVRKQ